MDPTESGGTAPRRAGIDLAAVPESVRAARAFMASMLDVWSCDDMDRVVELLTSEIVSNAVRHASGPIRVEAALGDDGSLRVAATDDHPAAPALRDADPEAEGGRGIRLVQRLARRWGVETADGHKLVWFETTVAHRPRAPSRSLPSPAG
ncbi:MAG: ATP-binding protein [Acidimicrobiales bacterium]